MNGKILRISSNDLYGNIDTREVIVFACFNHLKYMNKYILFTFAGEYDKKKIYYGSIYFKENSIVVFSVNQESLSYIKKFHEEYLQGAVSSKEYEILDISKINKIELVSYNDMACDNLLTLEKISIKKAIKEEENIKNKKSFSLYIILIFLIFLLIGLTYFYINPDMFLKEYKNLVCANKFYNDDLKMSYNEELKVLFDKKDIVSSITVIDSYIFSDRDSYFDFKNNAQENTYFKIPGTFKYNDDLLELKINYNKQSIIDSYSEMKVYLQKEGYHCMEGKYYE